MIIITALKSAIRDFWQSPHCAANYLQHVRSSGPGAVVCKSRTTHRALFCLPPLSLTQVVDIADSFTCLLGVRWGQVGDGSLNSALTTHHPVILPLSPPSLSPSYQSSWHSRQLQWSVGCTVGPGWWWFSLLCPHHTPHCNSPSVSLPSEMGCLYGGARLVMIPSTALRRHTTLYFSLCLSLPLFPFPLSSPLLLPSLSHKQLA